MNTKPCDLFCSKEKIDWRHNGNNRILTRFIFLKNGDVLECTRKRCPASINVIFLLL